MDFSTKLPKRKIAFSLFLSLSFLSLTTFYITSIFPSPDHPNDHILLRENAVENCAGIRKLADRRSKCEYARSNKSCEGKGYLNYLEIFYCTCADSPALGYLSLLLWLVVLFYVLGNTTSEYFCPSVASLSGVLGLSPTIAGTTLLPLGNGANDVFASIISFTRTGDAGVGLNSVLGGAFFISCVVVGVVSISISSSGVKVDRASFVRDVLFFVFVLCCLLVIIVFGRISLWFALCFVCVYVLYIGVVSVMHMFCSKEEMMVHPPVRDEYDFGVPLLQGCVDEEKGLKDQEQEPLVNIDEPSSYYLSLFVYVLELPLSLPRKLTIPIVSDEKWSKPLAMSSATLAPLFFAALFDKLLGENVDYQTSVVVYSASILFGIILGALALVLTKKSGPPKRLLVLWLAGGFLMSIAWTYVLVEELVSLLIAFGHILGISASILGLTVLAWGNSLGDLISNSAMALRGGPDGVQVALSGCYAGPIFNTLMGLGLSLVFGAWKDYPTSYPVPRDSDVYETVGFLMGGLLWALVILPKRDMKLDKFLGVGLLTIYFCFLFLRVVKCVGVLKLGT